MERTSLIGGSDMRGQRGILILAVVLVLASYPMQWYGTGGTGTSIALDDYRVGAALSSLGEESWNKRLLTQGELNRAWVSSENRGYKVNLTIILDNNPWRASVAFSSDNTPLENSTGLAGGVLLPLYVKRLGFALAFLWLTMGFLVPRVFGRKCPDCLQSFWNPVLLEPQESVVYTGGFDDEGDSLSQIARRDYVCPRCDYRRITYFIPSENRPGKVFRTLRSPNWLITSINQDEIAQKILDKWFEDNAKKTRFHNPSEWRAFYDELKATEREERFVTR